MPMRTPSLIFDFGNVVAHFDYRKACAVLGRELGLSGDAFLAHVRSLGFSDVVQHYERGGLSDEEFSRQVRALAGLQVEHAVFAAAWSDIFWLNEPVAALVAELKASGHTLVLGSNTNGLHARQFRRQFADTLKHFDAIILSYELGASKPAPEFYHACAAAAGTDPPACVFIDDLLENVAGAQAAGLQGIVYRDIGSLRAELATLGVRIDP